jgi:energy-converting hydrogenase Eha subunit C
MIKKLHAKAIVAIHSKPIRRVTIISVIGANSAIAAFFFLGIHHSADLFDAIGATVTVAEHILPSEIG